MASEFSRHGIDTTIITQQSTECGYPIDKAVQVVAASTNIKVPGWRNFVRNIKIRKLIKQNNPDIIISFVTAINIQTILYTLGVKSKVIVSERIYPATIRQPKKFFSKLVYPLADGFVFQTAQARDCFSGKVKKKGCIIYL